MIPVSSDKKTHVLCVYAFAVVIIPTSIHASVSLLKQFVAPSSIYLFLSVPLPSLFFIVAYYFILICVECVTAIISIEVSPTVVACVTVTSLAAGAQPFN